jgi:subtilisin family serine protease
MKVQVELLGRAAADCTTLLTGVIDDIYGANFVNTEPSGDPYDDNGHGTFVTGQKVV